MGSYDYRSTMDMYGSDHPAGYYHYPMGMAADEGEAAVHNGWSMATPSANPTRYGTSQWYAHDAATSVTSVPMVSNSGYDSWLVPSLWSYEWANNQQRADGMTYHQQMAGLHGQNQSLPLSVTQGNDGGYDTPEYSVDYKDMASVTLDNGGVPMLYTHTVKSEPAICKPELSTMDYAAPTPPASPFECVQFDHSALVAQTSEPPTHSEETVLFEVKILPTATHPSDVVKDQELQQQPMPQRPGTTPKPSKQNKPRKKQPLKSQLQTQWSCEECNKCFIRRLGLIQHNIIKHAGDRPFGCSKCGKRFADAGLLDQHAHRHQSMDKPFKCALCPKQFYYRMDLVRHGYKHTGNSPHVCAHCYKTFSRHDHLRRHEFIHEREKAENERD